MKKVIPLVVTLSFALSSLPAVAHGVLGQQVVPDHHSFLADIVDIDGLQLIERQKLGHNGLGILQSEQGIRSYQKRCQRLFLTYVTGKVLSFYYPEGMPQSLLGFKEGEKGRREWSILSPELKGYVTAVNLERGNDAFDREGRATLMALLDIFMVSDLKTAGNLGLVIAPEGKAYPACVDYDESFNSHGDCQFLSDAPYQFGCKGLDVFHLENETTEDVQRDVKLRINGILRAGFFAHFSNAWLEAKELFHENQILLGQISGVSEFVFNIARFLEGQEEISAVEWLRCLHQLIPNPLTDGVVLEDVARELVWDMQRQLLRKGRDPWVKIFEDPALDGSQFLEGVLSSVENLSGFGIEHAMVVKSLLNRGVGRGNLVIHLRKILEAAVYRDGGKELSHFLCTVKFPFGLIGEFYEKLDRQSYSIVRDRLLEVMKAIYSSWDGQGDLSKAWRMDNALPFCFEKELY